MVKQIVIKIYRALNFYKDLTANEPNPDAAVVTQSLQADLHGPNWDGTQGWPYSIVFKSLKHVGNLRRYIRDTRPTLHNAGLRMSLDGSRYV